MVLSKRQEDRDWDANARLMLRTEHLSGWLYVGEGLNGVKWLIVNRRAAEARSLLKIVRQDSVAPMDSWAKTRLDEIDNMLR